MKKRIFRINISGQKRVQLLKVPVVFLTISAIVLSNVFLVIPEEVYAGEVSYLSESPMLQVLPLNPMNPNQNLEEVPYETMYVNPDFDASGLNIGDVDGEVLQAAFPGVPVSLDCSGVEMSSNKYVCNEFSSRTNVSDDIFSGNMFRKDCEVNVLWATYPAFFTGGDPNKDGRIEIYKGEWPDAASALSQLQPSLIVDEVTGTMIPGDDYKLTNKVNFPPAGTDGEWGGYKMPTGSIVETGFKAQVVNEQPTVQPPGGEGKIAFPEKDCSVPPTDIPALECASPSQGLQDGWWGYSFMTPDPAKQLGRPIIEETACPMVEEVPYRFTCLDASGLIKSAWVYPITGIISDIRCLLTDDCHTNVQLYLFTDSLYGTNFGSESGADPYLDMMNAARSIPDPSRQCSSYVEGHNAPCFADRYIGTSGMCEVCGRQVPCTFVWKNWLYDFYERLRKEEGPCILENGDQFCTFEEYFEYVLQNAGGTTIF